MEGRLLGLITDDLVELAAGPVEEPLRAQARALVADRVSRTSGVTRLGVLAAEQVIAAAVRVTSGRPYAQLDDAQRRAWAARLTATRLPLIAEYVRLVRSLGIVAVYEARGHA